ncbi:hypothetical protein BX600DRAFT_552247 [Xylariales sp. PMI_506]|nr:hypothetical protein BX600DRAFT_552247 [Xylariales sp. PMI_506]
MSAITEIIFLSLKPSTSADSLCEEIIATLKQQPGCQRIRWSETVEDKTKVRMFIDWDDKSAYEKWAGSEAHQRVLDAIAPQLEERPAVHHVTFDPQPLLVLDSKSGKGTSPVAEVLYLHFPADESFTPDMVEVANERVQRWLRETTPEATGLTGEIAVGWTVDEVDFKGEKCKAIIVLAGWQSLEAHGKFRATEAFSRTLPIVGTTPGLKGVSVVHVSNKTVEVEH